VKLLPILTVAGLLGGLAMAPPATAAAPALTLQVIGPAKPVAAGDDITLEVILSTDGDRAHTFLLGSFPQAFGIYVLGPWGVVPPDPGKVRPENWMHQEHSAAAEVTVAKGKPYRTSVKLSDYFKVADPDVFKPGAYQVNVKFYESGWKMPAPIDSGPVRFELAPKK
jgi:hypothetical protein